MSDYLRVLRRRFRWFVTSFVAVILIAIAVTIFSPRQYDSTVLLYVSSQSSSDNATSAYQGSLLSEQRVKSYTQLLTSYRLADDTIKGASLPLTPDSLTEAVSASAQPDTVLLTATVRTDSPTLSAAAANGLAQSFSRLVSEIEQPADRTRAPAVNVRIVQPAIVPTSPASPQVALDLLLGSVIGLLCGVVAAFLRDSLDTSVRTRADLKECTGSTSILGSVRYDASLVQTPVADFTRPAPIVEDFRKIRTNLQFVNVDRVQKTLLVTSPLAGEGKSTFACNLAAAMAHAGGRVVLVEADLRRPRVSQYMQVDRAVGLSTVLAGRISLREVISRTTLSKALILPSGETPPNPTELLGSARMQEVLATLCENYDTVVIDAPPCLPVADAAAMAPLCDGVLLVVSGRSSKKPAVQEALASLDAVSARVVGAILSMASGSAEARTYDYYSDDESLSSTTLDPDTTKQHKALHAGGSR